MSDSYLIFIVTALLAEIIGTVAGFGASTVLLPVAALLYPLPTAIAYTALFHSIGTVWRTTFFARSINWKIAIMFGLPSLVMSYFGAGLLSSVSTELISRLLGMVLILFAVYSLVKHRLYLPRWEGYILGGGAVTGFLAGLVGTAGAIRGAFLTAWKLPKATYLGTGAVMGLGADATRIMVYYRDGLINYDTVLLFIFFIVALVGTYIGTRFIKRTTSSFFNKIILLGLALTGINFLLAW